MRVNKDVKNSKVGRLDMLASPVGILPAPVMKIWPLFQRGQWFATFVLRGACAPLL